MRTRVMGIMFAVLIAGCEDKAKPEYERCVQKSAPCPCTPGGPLCSCDPRTDLLEAWTACNNAQAADPKSKSGKLAAGKLPEIKALMDKQFEDEQKAKALAAARAAAARAAQEAADAKCSSWTTICTLGRFPDGSEQTTGLQHFGTKAACERIGAEMGGIPCDPCRCRD